MTTYICEGNEGVLDVSKHVKRAGPFLLGPKLGNSPVQCISHCLARKEGTDKYYTIKILTLKEDSSLETIDDQQGKVLLHTEYSLLNLLKGNRGVVQHHGLFKDIAEEEAEVDGKIVLTGKKQTRLCLVLDCYTPHDFCPKYTHLANLQYYVIKEKKLGESEAIQIFYNVVQIVERLHQQNIVHRDLKLGNIVLNKETREVFLSNFCLGKHLSTENDVLRDQRGSPAYISPDVISGKPYLGKPSDMWALGVVFYTMLYGQFPFYDQSPSELFRKIKSAEFHIPVENNVSQMSIELIQSLLTLNPKERLTAKQVLRALKDIMACEYSLQSDSTLQVVPDFPSPPSSSRGTWNRSSNQANCDSTRRVDRKRKSDFLEIEKLLASATPLLKKNANKDEEDEEDANSFHQPPRKIAKPAPTLGLTAVRIVKVNEEPRVLTVADLKKLHELYLANKEKEAEYNSGAPAPTTAAAPATATTRTAVAAAGGAAVNIPSSESAKHFNNKNARRPIGALGVREINALALYNKSKIRAIKQELKKKNAVYINALRNAKLLRSA
jgi:serine/threonine-protein kinase 40